MRRFANNEEKIIVAQSQFSTKTTIFQLTDVEQLEITTR